MKKPKPVKPKKGQESVWDYPRPPRLEKFNKTIEIFFNDICITQTNQGYRVLETSHPPVYYIPFEEVKEGRLLPSDHTTYCEWKGAGSYYDLLVNGKFVHDAAWYYDKPMRGFEAITGYPAFYAQKMDKCLIDGVEVKPQPGGFYGGWITPDIVGPFKGEEGTWGW
ncbi:MAG: DUF427 domain-containing protein [Bacteroidota bacterium]